jgi:hypothetical protein
MGDSFTDEYRFYTPDRNTGNNWVELLATQRGLKFGPFSAAKRAEPRNAGFANNWARSDATSDDMIRNQLPGLAKQVRLGQVNTAVIFIGGNDYLHYFQRFTTLNPPSVEQATADLSKIESRLDDNLTTAVRTLMTANPNAKVLLTTLPNIRLFPAFSAITQLPQAQPILGVADASIAQINARIATLAASEPGRIAVADLNGQYISIGQQSAGSGSLGIGTTKIDVRTPGDDYRHFFLADGIHIGTAAQGLLANLYAQTMDTAFNAGIKPLTPAEIIRSAKRPAMR